MYKVKHIVLPHRGDDGNDDDLEGIADKAMRVGWLSHRTVAFLLHTVVSAMRQRGW